MEMVDDLDGDATLLFEGTTDNGNEELVYEAAAAFDKSVRSGLLHEGESTTTTTTTSTTAAEASRLYVDVVVASPAVTSSTRLSGTIVNNTSTSTIQPPNSLVLTASPHSLSNQNSATLAILNVDLLTNNVHGIIIKKGMEAVVMQQLGGKVAVATVDRSGGEGEAPWVCGVDHIEEEGVVDRMLHEHRHEQRHEHSHHDHQSGAKKGNGIGEINQSLKSIQQSLRDCLRGAQRQQLRDDPNSNNRHRKTAATTSMSSTSTPPKPYSYQVDLLIELDTILINTLSSTSNQQDQDAIINYINLLFTAANSIMEYEIDTHLNVAMIQGTDVYDGSGRAVDVLNKMTLRGGGDSGWEEGVDLQVALLGKNIGGGIA